MKVLRILIILICASLFGANTSSVPDIKSIIQKTRQKYESFNKYKTQFVYRYYDKKSKNVPIEELKVEFLKDGIYEYTKTGFTEHIVLDKYIVFIDHEDKLMAIDEPSLKASNDDEGFHELPLDSILNWSKSFSCKEISSGYLCAFSFENHSYSRIEAYISKNYLIEKIVVFLKGEDESRTDLTGSRIEVITQKMEYNPPVPKEVFKTNKYFSIVNKAYKINATYKGYVLLNNLENK